MLARGIADPVNSQAILSDGGLHAIFQLRTLPAEDHAGAGQLPCITDRPRWNPHVDRAPVRCSRVSPLQPTDRSC